MSASVIRVALPVPLFQHFDYLLPDAASVQPGMRVQVPFGKRQLVGIIWQLDPPPQEFSLKEVSAVLDQQPVIAAELRELLSFAADYYQYPLGEVLISALPALLREGRAVDDGQTRLLQLTAAGRAACVTDFKRAPKQAALWQQLQHGPQADYLLSGESATVRALLEKGLAEWQLKPQLPFCWQADLQKSLQLNPAQALAVSAVTQAQGQFSRFLLEGVTGSGKTEVYLQCISPLLKEGKQVLVLVPEIGLTPQTLSRFAQRFAVPLQIWHSNMTDHERLQAWQRSQSGEAAIVIGTRSALFLPFRQLGLIIIDEEHDLSLKQQDGFRYHASDLATKRAALLQIPILLGSATPSLESLHAVQQQRMQYLPLPERATSQQVPAIELIDLKQQVLKHGLADGTIQQIKASLGRGQQILLFLNRRGFAPALICHECGWLTECRRCSAFTTFHKQSRQLVCHHCGFSQPVPLQCGGCGSTQLAPVGQGTEQLEEQLQHLFPATQLHRLDRDSTRRKGSLDQILNAIQTGEPALIVGTQMLAKGHHFPAVSLVVIVDVDSGLYSSDFRAGEHLAQLLTQVAGRAGRGDVAGKVLLQTHYPGHPLLQDLIQNGYHAFARSTLLERQQTQLPPYASLAVLKTESFQSAEGQQFLQLFADYLQQHWPQVQLLGPLQPGLERKAGKFRWQLQLYAKERRQLHLALADVLPLARQHPQSRKIKWQVDIDAFDLS